MSKVLSHILSRAIHIALLAALLAGALAFAAPVRSGFAEEQTTYTVKPGDNLSRIARQFAVPLADLRAANKLKNDVIFPGQKLIIPNVTIVGRAIGAGNFNTLVAAVKAAGLVDALNGPGPLTVFAPTDAAFAKLPRATLNALLADPKALSNILLYHVVAGDVRAAQVVNLTSATTLQGESIAISLTDGKVKVNNANVIATDITASNGVIHVIDTVILPPSLAAGGAAPAPSAPAGANTYTVKAGDSLSRIARQFTVTVADLRAANNLRGEVILPGQQLVIPTPNIVGRAAGAGTFNTLIAAAQAAGLVDALSGSGPLTVFAPTDTAFAKLGSRTINILLRNPDLLRKILLYHVVSGDVRAAQVVNLSSATSLQGSPISIAVSGGKVVLNGNATVTATDIPASNGVIHVIDTVILPPLDVLDVATLNGNFTTLVTAVKAAGLEGALRGSGPFTIFAPTDAAFAKLPAGTVAALLKDPAALSNILLYHVVSGDVRAAQVVNLTSATTLQGAPVSISVSGGTVRINNARVTATDIPTSNGIIHVIDTVILPPK
ncbi:MAG: fasciclin domain-containing protein [Anaerolineales bacterium]|nr:fasciclin domain-containing protein [Anaerolineales bacterium]